MLMTAAEAASKVEVVIIIEAVAILTSIVSSDICWLWAKYKGQLLEYFFIKWTFHSLRASSNLCGDGFCKIII
jgi:hypothetical protein